MVMAWMLAKWYKELTNLSIFFGPKSRQVICASKILLIPWKQMEAKGGTDVASHQIRSHFSYFKSVNAQNTRRYRVVCTSQPLRPCFYSLQHHFFSKNKIRLLREKNRVEELLKQPFYSIKYCFPNHLLDRFFGLIITINTKARIKVDDLSSSSDNFCAPILAKFRYFFSGFNQFH